MKLRSLLLVLTGLSIVVGAAYLGEKQPTSVGEQMTSAAEKFLGTLDEKQRATASFEFDSEERTNWHFIPMEDKERNPTRKGLALKDMTPKQRKAALELVRAGTSKSGYTQAITIMSLEGILDELEENGRFTRSPDWYFFSIFGTPSKTERWGWRIEGHHLSLNFTLEKGKVLSTTPAFFGANPALVSGGPKKGLRILAKSETLARKLFASLDGEQKKAALQAELHEEVEQGKAAPNVGKPTGLAGSKMSDKQKKILMDLIEVYANRMPPMVAKEQIADVKKNGIESVHFAFAEDTSKPGKPHTYRVQGKTFVIEFLNVQPGGDKKPANHIHSAWRTLSGDFGTGSD